MKLAIPPGWCLVLFSRSKLASQGIVIEGGVIDADFRGEIVCIVHNQSKVEKKIQRGERIAQGLFIAVPETQFHSRKLDETTRGNKGFGSTGC